MLVVLIVGGLLFWAGARLLLDAWWRRWNRPDLTELPLPHQPVSLADEAQHWLDNQD